MAGDKCEVHPDTREDHHTLAYLPTPTWGCAGETVVDTDLSPLAGAEAGL